MADLVDVVVLGGGVAGCAAAARLASAGMRVVVLEREPAYRDRVRGEALVNWGLAEVAAMGLGDVVLGVADAQPIVRVVGYDETVGVDAARAQARDLSAVLPGTPGMLGIGHPELREALASAARDAGATILRGVRGAAVDAGVRPAVGYRLGGASRTVRARLVLVADGANSAIRHQLGVSLLVTRPRMMLSGLVVDDGGAWDRAETVRGVEGASLFYVVPRGLRRVRLYLGRAIDDVVWFQGPGRLERFLDAFRLESVPNAAVLAGARPLGAYASFPMTDSWTESPLLPGVALLGDAAGWSNPVTGQGLAVALRDARVLTDLLLASGDWSLTGLGPYASERAERMARLRFVTALLDLYTAFGTPDRAGRRARMNRLLSRQPELATALGAIYVGPWRLPATAFAPDNLTALAMA